MFYIESKWEDDENQMVSKQSIKIVSRNYHPEFDMDNDCDLLDQEGQQKEIVENWVGEDLMIPRYY